MAFSKKVWNALLENEEGKLEEFKNTPKEWQGDTDVDKPVGPGVRSDEFGTGIVDPLSRPEKGAGIGEKIGNWFERDIVGTLTEKLSVYEAAEDITAEESDALRHYFGIKELSGQYGENIAWFLGELNEMPGFNWDNDVQTEADYYNNKIAMDHLKNKSGINWSDDLTKKDLDKILEQLVVPPSKDLPPKEQRAILDEEIWQKVLKNKQKEVDMKNVRNMMTPDDIFEKQKYGPFKNDILMQKKLIDEGFLSKRKEEEEE